jgi:transposase-like protein
MPEPILTTQQQHVLALLAQGSTVGAAAKAAGVHRNTVSNWRRAGSPEFRNAWQSAQVEQAAYWRDQIQVLGNVAVASILCILEDPRTTPSVRLKASLAVLNIIATPPPAHQAEELVTPELHIPDLHNPAQAIPAQAIPAQPAAATSASQNPAQPCTTKPDPLEEFVNTTASAPQDLAQSCTRRHSETDRHTSEAVFASLRQCPGLENAGFSLFST